MTRITPIKEKNKLVGFKLDGHASFRNCGYDIVCAAISCLSINMINSLQEIAHKEVDVYQGNGFVEYRLHDKPSIQSNILLESARLGYMSIAEEYPNNIEYKRK
ncbi:hypothetical protein SAMN02746066_04542 [Anaerosporobacter mobilis DSM 15930]|uniref:Ribosomal processing cysteine protease Prp n=1 Tax=Anaerosporobacter mobilis DSM 15930 TaxID=1120996 RepID=A0A1M7NIX4_9FIRM|nr:ribosomal-processing cysteine protease Prp [Anaerosporobacter mobilis]SHN03787.1 hypothetical protein SAMN02746066_04542 [Anaerosporobacter mobilis DSM 15930]